MPRHLKYGLRAIHHKTLTANLLESQSKDLPTAIKILKAKGLKFNGNRLIGKVDKWSDPKKPGVIFIRQTI